MSSRLRSTVSRTPTPQGPHDPSRRDFLRALGAVGAAGVLAPWQAAWAAEGRRLPNIVLILTDDQGYADVGCYGAQGFATPHLDEMAAGGVRFTDFYAAPVCSPSRAGLLTGCYPPRVGISRVLVPNSAIGLNPDEITIAGLLRERGYATACIGKWHLGDAPEFLPTRHGFDEYYGIPYSNDMTLTRRIEFAEDAVLRSGVTKEQISSGIAANYLVPLVRDERIIEFPADQTTLTKRYTEEAIRFISRNQSRPFFLFLSHTMPHVPLAVSPRFRGRSERGMYGDVIEELDWSVGELLRELARHGLDDDTLVVFASDNGPWHRAGEDGGSAEPLRGGKASGYEGGFRVPCIARWTGRIPAGTVCSQVAALMDLLPTIAGLVGATLPGDRVVDGRDIWPLMSAAPEARSPHEAFYYYRRERLAAVRSGDWKLHRQDGGVELYDLASDVGETRDVAKEHAAVVRRLSEMMDAFDAGLKIRSRPAGMLTSL